MIRMPKWIPAAAAVCAAALLFGQTPPAPDRFLEKPYLQIGNSPKLASAESMVLLWHTGNAPGDWTVQVRTAKDKNWRVVARPEAQLVSAPAGEPTVAGTNGAKADAP